MSIFSGFFGCGHKNLSRVFTIKNKFGAKRTYKVCLECGREFDYCLESMEIIGKSEVPSPTHREFVPELKR